MRKTIALATALIAALLVFGCQHKILKGGQTLPAFYGFFLFSQTLNQCPADSYQLPSHGSGFEALFRAGYLDGPYCHGFTKYQLSTKHGFFWNETSPIYVRLHTGAPCSIFVAIPAERMCSGQSLEQCASYRSAQGLARLMLQLLFKESPYVPRLGTLNVSGFPEHHDFEQWCAERIRKKFNATSHPVFKIDEPAQLEQNVD